VPLGLLVFSELKLIYTYSVGTVFA